MRFRHFKLKIGAYLVGLLLSLITLSWLLVNTQYYAVITLVLLVSVVLTVSLWQTLNTQLNSISDFFRSLSHDDFSSKLALNALGKNFQFLVKELNQIADNLGRSKQSIEQQRGFLKVILESLETAVLVYDNSGEVTLLNRSAQRLFGKNQINNIAELKAQQDALYRWLNQSDSDGSHSCCSDIDGYSQELLVEKVQVRVNNQTLWIVTLQNIQSALDDKEVKSWQEITRVLTHEISNSITPITSLASSCNEILKGTIEADDIADLKEAVETIEKRGGNLVEFIDNYRKLTKLPKLNLKRTKILALVNQVKVLYKQELQDRGVDFVVESNMQEINVVLDPVLIEQVLVNLVANAIAAVEEVRSPKITISVDLKENNLQLSISDNGKGILKEAIPKIFIPFYTTKHQGSGIGLSLSKLVMQLHSGSISVRSTLNHGSEFTLKF